MVGGLIDEKDWVRKKVGMVVGGGSGGGWVEEKDWVRKKVGLCGVD